jgi:Uma2 family endonuclease
MPRPTKARDDLFTVQEFYRRIPDDQKADLLDGVIYMASPDSLHSNDLTAFLTTLLRCYDEVKDLGGRVCVTSVAFRLSKRSAPEPDVAYVRPERSHLLAHAEVRGGPDLAVEIVSRDSRSRDYVRKKNAYQKAGVTEYWIVDPLKNKVEFHRLDGGNYQLIPLENGRLFRSQVLPGFWLDVHWLLANPLPKAYECLQKVLSGTLSS